MLVLRKELSFYEFMDEFEDELRGLTNEGVAIVFDSLCDTMYTGDHSAMRVRDYLRYQMQVLSLDEVIDAYGYDMELEGLEGDELAEAVERYISYNSYLLGTFEDDGELFFIFDEF